VCSVAKIAKPKAPVYTNKLCITVMFSELSACHMVVLPTILLVTRISLNKILLYKYILAKTTNPGP
jgi:hypothetical protein